LNIVPFQHKHISEATALALANLNDERSLVPALPCADPFPVLKALAGNDSGVAAFDGDRMMGFLCSTPPFDHAFRATDARGVFSPMGAHAAVFADRAKVYAAMYQAVAAKWVEAGAVSHALCLYAHDEELQRHFFHYGFGLRCIDAIRPMEAIDYKPCVGYDFVELTATTCHLVYPLDLALNRHYTESPFFMNRRPDTLEEFLASAMEDEARYFVATQGDTVCAYLKIAATGETFLATGDTYRHIRGAYCLPEHRGKGLYQNLLNFVIATLQQEGYTTLGVDFESFNPTGRGFWLKYFTPYTHSVVRRVDEWIVKAIHQ